MKGRLVPFLLFAPVVLGLSALLAWRVSPGLLSGAELADPDAYMRLLRVRTLAETGAWFDGTVPRSNWPAGETLHWTRPLDVLLLLGAWVLTPLVGFGQALHLAGVFLGPCLLLALFAATAWAAEPLVGERGRGFVLLALLAQPTVMTYALPGRPDHHALILLCFALALGFLFRGLMAPERARWARGLGVAGGLGLWTSPEFLLPLAFFLTAGMVVWMRRGGAWGRFNVRWTGVWAGTVAVALALERGGGFLAVEYDRISVVHLVVAALAVGVWGALTTWQARAGGGTAAARLLAGALAGGAVVGIAFGVYPSFFGGPMVEVTDPLVRAWLQRVTELQPALMPTSLQGAGLFLANAGTALLALAWTAGTRHRVPGPAHDLRLVVGAAMAACLALALFQVRWITYVQVLAAPALAAMVVEVRARLWPREPRGAGSLAIRAGTSAALVAGPLLAGAALYVAGADSAGGARAGGAPLPCAPEAVASYLATAVPEPRTVAAYMDLGPVILYRTSHRVLATPYHRNAQGLRAAYELLASVDEARALARARARGVELIVLCPAQDRRVFPTAVEGRPTLYGRLLAGDLPAWVARVDGHGVAGMDLYRVRLGP